MIAGALQRAAALARRVTARRGPVVLMYHRIADESVDPWGMCVSPEHFSEHMAVLARSRAARPLGDLARDLASGAKPGAAVAVTFDDGYADNLHGALPILERSEIAATFFIVASAIDGAGGFWWDELERMLLHGRSLPDALDLTIEGRSRRWQLRDEPAVGERSDPSEQTTEDRRAWRAWNPPRSARERAFCEIWVWLRDRSPDQRGQAMETLWSQIEAAVGKRATTYHAPALLGGDELERLAAHRLAEIGAHTKTHPRLCRLPVQDRRAEIATGKVQLERVLGHRVAGFAYPFGEWDAETVHLVREANFDYACTGDARSVTARSSLFTLPRLQVEDCDGDAFAERLSRLLPSATL